MGKDFRTYLLVVGLPALALTAAAVWLAQIEMGRATRPRPTLSLRIDAKTTREQAEAYKRAVFEKIDAAAAAYSACPPAERKPLRVSLLVVDRGRVPSGANRFAQAFSSDSYSPWFVDAEERAREDDIAVARIFWIGGCVVGLMFLSLVAGGWILVRAARKAREEALQKTDFVSNVSHEFKTPLTSICLCAELAQDEGLSPERRQKALKASVAESNRLKSLVLNALDFSRLERNRRDFHPEAADLAVLAREAAEPLRERFQAGLELPTGPCPACVDHSAFRQVVVILLDNAAKYAAAGGPVTVETEVGLGRVELRVLDRGPGLSREALRHVFDRFWRGDNATTSETGGSGLGLAIARGLANGMGGTLGVVVRPSGGLVFTLRLPA